MASSPNRVSV